MAHDLPVDGKKFADLGLSPKILVILEHLRYTIPTPIQTKAIPVAVQGHDVIGIAQTGTGKTLAFVLPLLQQIAHTKKRGLIILPTRELAMQVDEVLQKLGQTLGLRKALLIGGASMPKQINELRHRPHVIVGTPGRIIDHLRQKHLQLGDIGVLVLDEADRMLDMGFAPQLKVILAQVPSQRQTLLFSATMPTAIVKIAATHMKMPVRVEMAPTGTVAERINQELFIIDKVHKNRLLDTLLDKYQGTVLVFSRTKHGAKRICRAVRGMGHNVAEIHSNLSLSQRKKSLNGFKTGTYRILIATDIAARGIDVNDIALVINYDLPDNLDDYVHRIGRTGRAGKAGQAISFITPDQRSKIRNIERIVRASLRVSPLPNLPAARAQAPIAYHEHRQFQPRTRSRENYYARKPSGHSRHHQHHRKRVRVHS